MTPNQHARAVDAAICEFPDLTSFGFGTYLNNPDTFDDDRAELYSMQVEFERCVEYINLRGFRKTYDRLSSSYGLKHDVERWWRKNNPPELAGYGYVSNGVMIAALHFCGAKIKRSTWGSPNAITNLRRRYP